MAKSTAIWILTITLCLIQIAYGQTSLPRPARCRNASATEQDISDKYFKPYGIWQRPRLNGSNPVDVNITFVLSSINEVLEKDRIIKLSAYLAIRWHDEFRVWRNDFPLNCVDYVVLPATELWIPDIAQLNAEGRYTLMAMPMEKVRVYSYGFAAYSPGGTFMAFYFDLTLFPFDTQRCAVKIESWMYTVSALRFHFGGNVTINSWSENEQWSLVSTSQEQVFLTYTDPGNAFDHLEFYFVIKRKVMHYFINIIVPSTVISVAQLATFSLPVSEFLKIHVSFTCLLAYTVFQLMIVEEMPRSSDHVPLLSFFIDLQMAYIALSMLLEGLVFMAIRQSRPKEPDEVPTILYTILCFIGERVLFVGKGPQPHPRNSSTRTNEEGSSKFHLFPNSLRIHGIKELANGTARTIDLQEDYQSKFDDEEHNEETTKKNIPRENLPDFEFCRCKWEYCARVFDRLAFTIYLGSLIITPIAMFALHPARTI